MLNFFFFSSRRRHTRCALVTGVQTCALPISPAQIDPQGLRTALMEDIPALTDVHHIHAWSLTTERPLTTLHAQVRDTADPQAVLEHIKRVLASRFGIDHSTVQIERVHCGDD